MRVLVIGAGFAGVASALRLRLAGADVTVIEAAAHAGGKARLGWPDVPSGPTVVTMPFLLQALLERVGLPPPDVRVASPLTRYAYADGRTFAPELSVDATLAQLSPDEARAYTRLLGLARNMYEDARDTFLFAPPPGPAQLARYAVTRGARARPLTSLARLVSSGPVLTPFFLRFATYLGADPYRAPAVLHNISWVELGMGVWHLAGGAAGLVAALEGRARELGVRFEYGVRAKELVVEGGRARGALTTAGPLAADAVVSAADRAFTRLLLGLPPAREAPGISGLALQLRLARPEPDGHHVLFPQDYAREWREIRGGRLPSRPSLYVHTSGERAFLLVNAPPDPAVPCDRDAYAAELLRQVRDRLPPDVSLDVAAWNVLSPREYATTGLRGALYGRAPHGLLGALRPGWRVPGVSNVRQVGGTVHPGGGVPLSLLSGWNGAGDLLGLPYDDLGGRA